MRVLRDLTWTAAAAALLVASAPAAAQQRGSERRIERAPERAQQAEPPAQIDDAPSIAVTVGLGVTEFAGDTMDDVTDVGASYDARVIWDTGRLIHFEAANFGTRQSITTLDVGDDANLTSHALEGVAKLDLERFVGFQVGGVGFSPFVVAGLGAGRYSIGDVNATQSSFADTDYVLMIPTAAGLSAETGNWLFDARLSYRIAFDEDLLRVAGRAADASLDNWNIMARAGLEF